MRVVPMPSRRTAPPSPPTSVEARSRARMRRVAEGLLALVVLSALLGLALGIIILVAQLVLRWANGVAA